MDIFEMAKLRDMTEVFSEKYDPEKKGAIKIVWDKALKDGLTDESSYNNAKKLYRNLWNVKRGA